MSSASLAVRLAVAAPVLLLMSTWWQSAMPALPRLIPFILFVVSCWRPRVGFLVLAAAAPACGVIGIFLAMPVHGVRLLEQLVLAVIAAALLRARWRPDLRLLWPGMMFLCVVAASLLVTQPIWLIAHDTAGSWHTVAGAVLAGRAFEGSADWGPLTTALRLLAGAGLAIAAEAWLRDRPDAVWRIVAATLAGSTVAATDNFRRLFEVAQSQAGSGVSGLLSLLVQSRINTQTDVNAGGSLFALVCVAGIGLLARRGWTRWTAGSTLTFVLVGGLWLSGARSAMAAALVAVIGAAAVVALRAGASHRRRAVTGVVALVIVCGGAVALYPSSRNFAISSSVDSRLIFYKTAVRMWRESPVAGAGVGTFFERSAEYGAAEADRILIMGRTKDNAHNYFLQVLAELGVVGLVLYVLMLAPTVLAGVRTRASGLSAGLPLWLACGLAAYLTSALTGHPQLLSETVMTFWLLLGALAALAPPLLAMAGRIGIGAAVGLVVLLILTDGMRREISRDLAPLEHQGTGVSGWHVDESGQRFRIGGEDARVFVATGATVSMPVGLAADEHRDDVSVDVLVEGQVVNKVTLSKSGWTRLQLSIRPSRRRFVELSLRGPAGATFRFGKADAKPLE